MTRDPQRDTSKGTFAAPSSSAIGRRGLMTAAIGASAAGLISVASATPAHAKPPADTGAPFAPRDHTHDGNALGKDQPVSRIHSVESYTREYPRIDVAMFGAVGDGVSDDSAALQSAMDAAKERSGIVAFDSDKVYAISETITVDVSGVRGIEGNLARIKLTRDTVAFAVTGTHTGNASPKNASARRIKLPEMHPYMRGLRIHAEPELQGTGLRVEGTFGLQITQCHLFDLGTGIEFSDVNRNVILSDSNIWHCGDYGIWWNGGNIHQMNITGSHISYTRKALFMDDALIYNLQVVGNAIEAASAPGNVEYVVHAIAQEGYIEGLEFIGNSLEDHVNISGAAVRVDGGPNRRGKQIMIIGNDMGNTKSNDIHISNMDEVVIANNTMSYSTDYSIRLTGHVLGVNVTGNVMNTRNDRAMGMLYIGEQEVRTSVDGLLFSNNIASNMIRLPVVAQNSDMRSVNFSGNIIDYVGEKSGPLVDIFDDVNVRSASVTGNQFRTPHAGSVVKMHTKNVDLFIAKDNIADGAGAEAFSELPTAIEGRVVIGDNIAG